MADEEFPGGSPEDDEATVMMDPVAAGLIPGDQPKQEEIATVAMDSGAVQQAVQQAQAARRPGPAAGQAIGGGAGCVLGAVGSFIMGLGAALFALRFPAEAPELGLVGLITMALGFVLSGVGFFMSTARAGGFGIALGIFDVLTMIAVAMFLIIASSAGRRDFDTVAILTLISWGLVGLTMLFYGIWSFVTMNRMGGIAIGSGIVGILAFIAVTLAAIFLLGGGRRGGGMAMIFALIGFGLVFIEGVLIGVGRIMLAGWKG